MKILKSKMQTYKNTTHALYYKKAISIFICTHIALYFICIHIYICCCCEIVQCTCIFPWDKWSWKIFDNFLSNINSSYFTSLKQHEISYETDCKCIYHPKVQGINLFLSRAASSNSPRQPSSCGAKFPIFRNMFPNFQFSRLWDICLCRCDRPRLAKWR